jgi:ElaA protein
MLDIRIKQFNDLNIYELYALLRMRSEVFVVEQNCVYQDLDEKDKLARHVLAYKNGLLSAYTRIFAPGDYFKEASIGRVVVAQSVRGSGLGYQIMRSSIDYVKDNLNVHLIRISAQTYLKDFYNNLNFHEEGEEYLEDGIPHINMIYKTPNCQ